MTRVRIDVLGPLRVHVDGLPVAVDGERRRRLLAALVARRGAECSADWLVDVTWDGRSTPAAIATLQSHVAHLRRLLEPGRVAGTPWRVVQGASNGYSLAAEQVDVDADRLIAAVQASRGADDDEAVSLIDAALTGVRGEAFGTLGALPAIVGAATALDELVITAREIRLAALVRSGRHAEAIESARALVVAHPLRESNWAELATAQAHIGQQAEALRSLAHLREILRDELGIDPSPAVAALELRVLRQELHDRPRPVSSSTATVPATVYAASDDGVHIAYQMLGSGPALVAAPPLAQNIEICWQDPNHRRLLEHAARRCTFVHFDKRGTGMSDRVVDLTLQRRLRDFETVLDDARIERAVLAGVSEAGPLAIAFAAAHPERVAGLVLINTFARATWAPDHPIGTPPEAYAAVTAAWEAGWGRDATGVVDWFAPSMRDDRDYRAWLAHYMRQSCSPGTLRSINEANGLIDVRPLLADIAVPALVIHRADDRVCGLAHGRHLAAAIPGAELMVVPGADHLPWIGDTWRHVVDAALDFTERVSAGVSRGPTDS